MAHEKPGSNPSPRIWLRKGDSSPGYRDVTLMRQGRPVGPLRGALNLFDRYYAASEESFQALVCLQLEHTRSPGQALLKSP